MAWLGATGCVVGVVAGAGENAYRVKIRTGLVYNWGKGRLQIACATRTADGLKIL